MRCPYKPQRHKGTKAFAKLLFVPLCLCGSAFYLQGCTLFGVGESEYACPEPGKGVCKSARQVYQETDTPTTDTLMTQPLPSVLHTPPDRSMVVPEALPQRIPAQVLRIWIAPWVDKQGNWHSGGVVMTDIYPREWQSAAPVFSPSENE